MFLNNYSLVFAFGMLKNSYLFDKNFILSILFSFYILNNTNKNTSIVITRLILYLFPNNIGFYFEIVLYKFLLGLFVSILKIIGH
jgi:hypothetical protein